MARYHILILVGFTMINIVMVLLNTGSRFLFSATVPTALVETLWILTGHARAEVYVQGISYETIDGSFLVIALLFAFVLLGVYVLCYVLSKKHPAFMIVATVLFAVDCAALVWFYGANFKSVFWDVLFHVWVMYYFVLALIASARLKHMPPDPQDPIPAEAVNTPAADAVSLQTEDRSDG